MPRIMLRLTWKELVAAILLLVVLVAVLLPALGRARESASRSSCANNLKQIGLIMNMFVNESKKSMYPPLSPYPGNWIMDMNRLYPEYVSDLSVFICPKSPFRADDTFRIRGTFEHPNSTLGDLHPDCVSSLFYTYTGYSLLSDEQAFALYEAFQQGDPNFYSSADIEAQVPIWPNSGRHDAFGSEGIPIVWDRIPPTDPEFSHPMGANVLHHNGSVQFVPYSPYNTSNNFPVTRLTALTFGSSAPTLSPDCY